MPKTEDMIHKQALDSAWSQFLKGDYEEDMQQLQALGGQETAQAVSQSPIPAPYKGDPEGWAEDYMSNVANMQGTVAANVGDPDFPLQSLGNMPKTGATERMEGRFKSHKESQQRLKELQAIADQAAFEGHPRFKGNPARFQY